MAALTGRILFLVLAPGGGRRITDGSLRLVGGMPLVGRAVRAARGAATTLDGGPHRVVCATDDGATRAAAAAWGAEVVDGPPAPVTSEAPAVDVAMQALEMLAAGGVPFSTLVLLLPTSPLIDPRDIVGAVERHRQSGGSSVTSVVEASPATRQLAMTATGALGPGSGAGETVVRHVGAFSVVSPDELRESRAFVTPGRTLGYVLPRARAIEVEGEEDLLAAEAILAARPVRPVPMGDRSIGAGPVFVIAEGGVNHNGDPALALRLVDAAADAGADAIKFQTFDPAALAAAGAPTAAYQRRAGVDAVDQRAMLEALALPAEAWGALQARARDRGLAFLSTPFDDGSAELLDRLDVLAFKVGSGELTNLPFIGRLARRGRPLLLSTGMADILEVAQAVDTVRANRDVPLALLHCVSSYPARAADANLRAIETLRRAFGVPVGWSDHTPGIDLDVAAAAVGAAIIEKHVTLDRTMPGPDHQASIEPDELARMVSGVRAAEAALGSGIKAPVAAEADVARVARRSLHWSRDLRAGHVVEAADVAVLRPGTGLPPSRLDAIVGRRTTRAVAAGAPVEAADVERPA